MATYQNVTPNQLGQAAIGTAVSTIYTAPKLTRVYLRDINIVNTNVAANAVNVYLVPSGGTAGTANALLYAQSIATATAYRWTGVQVLLPSQSIQVSATLTGATVIASGGEAT